MNKQLLNWSIAFLIAANMVALPARADPVIDWNTVLVSTMIAAKTHAPMQSRNAALVHGAMFEAVNSIQRRFVPYSTVITSVPGASVEAAAATAAHRALVALYPTQAVNLNSALERSLAGIADASSKQNGIAVGEQVAAAMLRRRADDGSDASKSYVRPDFETAYAPAPGVSPLAPHWGNVRPWLLKSGSQFRPSGPAAVDSAQFRRDYQEVKGLGGKNSTLRTPEQMDVARFWIPPGVPSWGPVARQLSSAAQLDIADNARLFALLSMATADAIIACWDAKYTFSFMRPDMAIRSGKGGDADSDWEPAIPTPPFPAYPSGHACFGGAAQVVLESVFGQARLVNPVSLTSPTAPGVTRRYERIADIVDEISNARIWGGIHWRTDQKDGEDLGRRVGGFAVGNALQSEARVVRFLPPSSVD
jgi:hypothetical protein